MSEQIQLEANPRERVGTAASRNLRRDNRVPAILYGGDREPTPISLSLFDLQRIMQRDTFYTSILELKTDDKVERAVLKALDQHPTRNEPLHLDFLRVTDSTKVTMAIPLSFINEDQCVGVKAEGGVVTYQMTQVTVQSRADSIPERLEVDMLEVPIGSPVLLSQVPLPANVHIPLLEQGQDPAVAIVLAPRVHLEDEIEAEAAEAEGEEAEAAEGEEAAAKEGDGGDDSS